MSSVGPFFSKGFQFVSDCVSVHFAALLCCQSSWHYSERFDVDRCYSGLMSKHAAGRRGLQKGS